MGKAAAKRGDKITAKDMHTVKPNDTNIPPYPFEFSFSGSIADGLSGNVRINGAFAALVGSGADNSPKHDASSFSATFLNEPNNKGTVTSGSARVRINSKAAVRDGDPASTCHEPPPPGDGKVEVANATSATVRFG